VGRELELGAHSLVDGTGIFVDDFLRPATSKRIGSARQNDSGRNEGLPFERLEEPDSVSSQWDTGCDHTSNLFSHFLCGSRAPEKVSSEGICVVYMMLVRVISKWQRNVMLSQQTG